MAITVRYSDLAEGLGKDKLALNELFLVHLSDQKSFLAIEQRLICCYFTAPTIYHAILRSQSFLNPETIVSTYCYK